MRCPVCGGSFTTAGKCSLNTDHTDWPLSYIPTVPDLNDLTARVETLEAQVKLLLHFQADQYSGASGAVNSPHLKPIFKG